MASRESINQEAIALVAQNRLDAYDVVRKQKLQAVVGITGRPLVVYAVDAPSQNPIKGQLVGAGLLYINVNDKDVFDEMTRNLTGRALDVLLHSPGGSAEATESIVHLLRARFDNIRFIVPSMAKSAATMLAMSGDQVVMDEISELGPTDPQMQLVRDGQPISSPAQAIVDLFRRAQDEVNRDPSALPSWVPILREFGPSLLAECYNY